MSSQSLPTSTAGRVALGLFWILALAFGGWWWWTDAQEEAQQRQRSAAAAEVSTRNARGAHTVATYPGPGGQVVVLDIVAPDPNVPKYNERRRCFLWRGAGGDSLTCEAAARIDL